METVAGAVALFFVALPAVLPVAALAGWSVSVLIRPTDRRWSMDNAVPYQLACVAIYVASVYPRADVEHLAFVAVLPAALTAIWIARYTRPAFATALFVLAAGAGLFLAHVADHLRGEIAVATPVGTLRASASDAKAVAALCRIAHPRDTLYVHPYMPVLYFLTQARNPTRYSYLQPGLMTWREQVQVLDTLRNSPPQWLLYLPISRAEFLRIYPHAAQLNHQFPYIEAWRASEYVPVEPAVVVGGYRLYQRKGEYHAGAGRQQPEYYFFRRATRRTLPVCEMAPGVSASFTISACSCWWRLPDPVAGLALSGRPTYRTSRPEAAASGCNCSFMNGQGPMLRGSSCAHTISAVSG
jgi:hypothetical protein